jgi:hypothetical protein
MRSFRIALLIVTLRYRQSGRLASYWECFIGWTGPMPGEIPVARALFKLEDRLVSLDALS